MRIFLLCFFTISSLAASAQKIEAIYFNLYTDSLKKGFYNYISVDGKLSDGRWLPLDTTQIKLTSNTGFFKGNDLFIDSSYAKETISVRAVLKKDTAVWKEVVISIRKRSFDEPLKTGDEILKEMRKEKRRKNRLVQLIKNPIRYGEIKMAG